MQAVVIKLENSLVDQLVINFQSISGLPKGLVIMPVVFVKEFVIFVAVYFSAVAKANMIEMMRCPQGIVHIELHTVDAADVGIAVEEVNSMHGNAHRAVGGDFFAAAEVVFSIRS